MNEERSKVIDRPVKFVGRENVGLKIETTTLDFGSLVHLKRIDTAVCHFWRETTRGRTDERRVEGLHHSRRCQTMSEAQPGREGEREKVSGRR